MSEWIECDNVEAIKQKTEGNDVERFWSVNDKWVMHIGWGFPPEIKYRYRIKSEFKEGEPVLCWDDEKMILIRPFAHSAMKSWNKVIPLQSEIVEIEKMEGELCFWTSNSPSEVAWDMLKDGEHGRFMILRIPE